MFRKSRFGDVMKGLSRGVFDRIVTRHEADKYSKGFGCYDQLVAMIYGQLSGCRSLRELEASFNGHCAHHYHLGSRPLKRSTLADANSKRRLDVFGETCDYLLQQAHRRVKGELKELLYLLDSTPIRLTGRGYEAWTQGNHNHRTHGLKVHLVLSPRDALPVHTAITAPNVNDVEVGRTIALETGATYVFDKAYVDYNWWHKIHQHKAVFVTRFKGNAGVKVMTRQAIPASAQETIQEDAKVCFKNKRPGGKRINRYHDTPLRRIVVNRPDKKTPLILATNDFERSAEEIAALYKRRWAIELFFKWLKQNLKIKQFFGRSENAVKIQIYCALIAYLLVQLYHRQLGQAQTLTLCLAELRVGLFQRAEAERHSARKRYRWRKDFEAMQGALPL